MYRCLTVSSLQSAYASTYGSSAVVCGSIARQISTERSGTLEGTVVWLGAAARSCNNTICPYLKLSISSAVHSLSSHHHQLNRNTGHRDSSSISARPTRQPDTRTIRSYPLSRTLLHRSRTSHTFYKPTPPLSIIDHIHRHLKTINT